MFKYLAFLILSFFVMAPMCLAQTQGPMPAGGGMPGGGMLMPGMPGGGMLMPGMPGGGMLMPGMPGYSEEPIPSKGEIFMDTYGSSKCGEEIEKVTDSIKRFTEMVDKIKRSEQCEEVKKTLNDNIPKLSDIHNVATARSKLQLIRQYERELRDIENSLSELHLSPQATMGKTQALGARKQQIQVKLVGLKREIGETKHTQQISAHKTVINNIDQYSQALGTAIQNECLSQQDGTATQALLSLTGLAGLMLSSTPLGLGLSGAVKLTRNLFSEIGDKYSTKGVDKSLMTTSLRCTITVLNQEHCDLIKNKTLVDQVETEADYCEDDCKGFNYGYGHSQGHGMGISNILDTLSFTKTEDVDDFILDWYDPATGAEQRKQSLYTLSHLVNEPDIPNRPVRGFNVSIAKEFFKKIQATAQAFKKLEEGYDNKVTEKELNKYKIDFMNSLNALTATESLKQLNHFNKLLSYQNKLMIQRVQKHNEETSNQTVSPELVTVFNTLRIRTVSTIFNLPNLTAIKNKQNNMRHAFDGNFKKMQAFSDIFQNDAEQALQYITNDMYFESGRENEEQNKTKSDMCLRLLGLTCPSQKIKKQCSGAKVQFLGKDFNYNDFVGLPHEERVCAVQDFYRCAEDSSSPACYDHKRRKKMESSPSHPNECPASRNQSSSSTSSKNKIKRRAQNDGK